MIFENQSKTTTEDIAQLFSVLTKVNTLAQELSLPNDKVVEGSDLIIKSLSLNSPLKIETIATGIGAVLLILQIMDLGGNFLLEREKLQLEIDKLKYDIHKIEISRNNEAKIDLILNDLKELKLNLKSLKAVPAEDAQN